MGNSPQGQEKQEGSHEGGHRNTVTQVVDNKGDAVVQVVLPLLDRQTHRQMEAWGTQRLELATPATAPLCVLSLEAEMASSIITTSGSSRSLPLAAGGSWYRQTNG